MLSGGVRRKPASYGWPGRICGEVSHWSSSCCLSLRKAFSICFQLIWFPGPLIERYSILLRPDVSAIGSRGGMSMSALAAGWVLARGAQPIIGAQTPGEARQIAALRPISPDLAHSAGGSLRSFHDGLMSFAERAECGMSVHRRRRSRENIHTARLPVPVSAYHRRAVPQSRT